jgi:hypothetical protein
MKRSSQVLLVVMGVAGATAAGHYLTTPNECAQQVPAAKSGALPQQQVTQQPCRNTSSTRTGYRSWWGSSDNSGSSSSEHTKTASNSPTSVPGATRGGFGGTAHGFFSGS